MGVGHQALPGEALVTDRTILVRTVPEGEKEGAHCLVPPCPTVSPVALDSLVLGDTVPATCRGSTSCLPLEASVVAEVEEAEGLWSGLGVAFEAWELARVGPGVT